MSLVSIDDVRAAADRVATTCLRTPVLPFAGPGGDAAASLWVKAESLQPTGAFKLRGATNAVAQLDAAERSAGVVTHSSGNHAQALAFAAAAAGVSATVVMPEGSPEVKVEGTRRLGAEVVLVPVAQRVSACDEIVQRTGATLVLPFDDARVIAGQGTVGLEVVEQVPDVDAVLVPVSGGGLLSGVAVAVKALSPRTRVIGVEPELAGDLAEGFAAGERRVWSVEQTGRTVADGLRVPAVGELAWEHVRSLVDDVVTVSEEAIVSVMRELVGRTRLVVEPSGAVAAAAFVEHADRVGPGTVVAIASGGNVDPSFLASVLTG